MTKASMPACSKETGSRKPGNMTIEYERNKTSRKENHIFPAYFFERMNKTMKMKRKMKQIISGLLAAVTIFSGAVSPLTASAAETDPKEDVYKRQVLNSKDFGVPQSRKRVYIIGYLDGRCAGKILPVPVPNGAALIQVLAGSQGKRVYDPAGVSCTLTSQAGGMGGKTDPVSYTHLSAR